MPKLIINGKETFVEDGKRLVLAIEQAGLPIGHRCGGWARCTTCRVEFVSGEPATMTAAEYERLTKNELLGKVRLACQIVCDHEMSVNVLVTADDRPEWDGDTGPTPAATVTPESTWRPIEEFRRSGD
jgi:ferredoxin